MLLTGRMFWQSKTTSVLDDASFSKTKSKDPLRRPLEAVNEFNYSFRGCDSIYELCLHKATGLLKSSQRGNPSTVSKMHSGRD